MKVGMDLDGPIWPIGFYNPSIRLPWPLFFLLVPIIVFLKPDKEVVKKMQVLKDRGCKIAIVSATPRQFLLFRKWLLKLHHVPFESLDCVGGGKGTNERKLKIIREKKIEVYIDKDGRVLRFMQRNSVRAESSLDCLN